MTSTKHTPAPWVVRGDKKVVSNAKGFAGLEVANCMTYDATIAQRQANACLIAAAPELLEALELMVNTYKGYGWGVDEARAAIAKAKGE